MWKFFTWKIEFGFKFPLTYDRARWCFSSARSLYLGAEWSEFRLPHCNLTLCFRGFPRSFRANVVMVPLLGQVLFIPNRFKYISHHNIRSYVL
jgi:hypothetical protein